MPYNFVLCGESLFLPVICQCSEQVYGLHCIHKSAPPHIFITITMDKQTLDLQYPFTQNRIYVHLLGYTNLGSHIYKHLNTQNPYWIGSRGSLAHHPPTVFIWECKRGYFNLWTCTLEVSSHGNTSTSQSITLTLRQYDQHQQAVSREEQPP